MGRLIYRSLGRDGDPWPDWVKALRGSSGVYVVKSEGRVRYVGESHSGKLYGTLTRHFQRWKGRTAGVKFSRRRVKVAVVLSRSPLKLQDRLIRRLKPTENIYGEVPF